MCTATTYKNRYFGRNLDLEYSYDETVTVTPRNYVLSFRSMPDIETHSAIIGIAYVQNGYPLYYDAVNEHGLGMAGLSFEGNCVYNDASAEKYNLASFELIPWILAQCRSVAAARELLDGVNITNAAYSEDLPPTPLHWFIADKDGSITLEQTKDGLKLYQNPPCVLTNNPTFDIQLHNLNNYMSLSAQPPKNHFSRELGLKQYSRGMGAIGMPGDLSSSSRFIRAAFTRANSKSEEAEDIGQFFHILASAEQQKGCVDIDGRYEITVYSSCCDTQKGIYYYRTYNNSRITAVNMHKERLDGTRLVSYSMKTRQDIEFQN